MSLFYGVINYDKRPDQGLLDKMHAALSSLPHVLDKRWNNELAGMGHMLRISTPESKLEFLPYTEEKCTIVAYSRIDNREKILGLIGIHKELHASLPDAILILKAYLFWGNRCVEYFEGDWAVSIWDDRNQRLFLAVDHLSGHGIYYYNGPSFFAFANNKAAILAVKPDAGKLNELFVLRTLLIYYNQNPETTHKDVYYVPPGHLMMVDGKGNIVKKRYWFPTRIKRIHYRKEEEYVEHFYDLYNQAVRSRLRSAGKTGSHLSGGLDSGSVAYLAAQWMKQAGQTLTAFTGTACYPTDAMPSKFDDEAYYAALTANAAGNIEQVFFRCPDTSVLQSIRFAAEHFLELYHGIGNLYWLLDISRYARQEGFTVVLNGQVGNATISWKGVRLRTRVKSNLMNVYYDLQTSFSDGKKKLGSFIKIPFTLADEFTLSLLKEQFLNDYTLDDLIRQDPDELDKESNYRISTQRMKLLNPRACSKGLFWQTMGQNFDLHYWDPTRDKALVEFCLGLPEGLYSRNGGRNMIRKAMENKMPQEVVFNNKTGLQASDLAIRLSKEPEEIARLLDQVSASSSFHKYVKMDVVRKAVEELRMDPNLFFQKSGQLTRIFGLIYLTCTSDEY